MASVPSVGGVAVALVAASVILASPPVIASDEARNAHAVTDCRRGSFANYYREGEGGDPPAGYDGPVFRLSQDYPARLPQRENYPWAAIPFENGAPQDPAAYLAALLAFGLEGNAEVDFAVEKNSRRSWFHMPWMHWNTEVAADHAGTDGREFVHGLTHEFDTSPKTLSELQGHYVDTWAGAYFNDRAAFSIGQVWCDPDEPDLGMVNPDPAGRNNFADGAYVIKLLFTTADAAKVPVLNRALEWDADIYEVVDPQARNEASRDKSRRRVQRVRLLQIDVAVRDDRSLNGWLFGTFAYDGSMSGETVWDRFAPIGLQWGNDPGLAPMATCPEGSGRCDPRALEEQWIDKAVVDRLAAPPLNLSHLGFGGRLAGPVDDPRAGCMSCHQTAGFPPVPALPAASDLGALAKGRGGDMDFVMAYFRNTPSGVAFSPVQLHSADYALQLSMSVMNFASVRCAHAAASPPAICTTLSDWQAAMGRFAEGVNP